MARQPGHHTLYPEVGTYQQDKEVTINAQRGRFDAALTEVYEIVGDTDVAIRDIEFIENLVYRTDGAQTDDIFISFNQGDTDIQFIKKWILVDNSASSYIAYVHREGDAATPVSSIPVNPGYTALMLMTWTTEGGFVLRKLWERIDGGETELLKVRPEFVIADTVSQLVYQRVMTKAQTLLSNANGLVYQVLAVQAPTTNLDFDIEKNGTQVGTGQILAGQFTGTITVASNVSFTAGDRLGITITSADDDGRYYAMTIELNP